MSVISPSTIPLPGETISQMPAATLPLTLQELVPLVQLGANVKTSLQNFVTISGGIISSNQITSGLTGPLAKLASINLWNSLSLGAKTQPIPTSAGTYSLIIIMDQSNTAGNLGQAITAVPLIGSIIGNNQVYTSLGSITLIDTPYGWVSQ